MQQQVRARSDGSVTWGPVFELPADYVQHARRSRLRPDLDDEPGQDGRRLGAQPGASSTAARNGLYESMTRARARTTAGCTRPTPMPGGRCLNPEVGARTLAGRPSGAARWSSATARRRTRSRWPPGCCSAWTSRCRRPRPASARFRNADHLGVLMADLEGPGPRRRGTPVRGRAADLIGDDLTREVLRDTDDRSGHCGTPSWPGWTRAEVLADAVAAVRSRARGRCRLSWLHRVRQATEADPGAAAGLVGWTGSRSPPTRSTGTSWSGWLRRWTPGPSAWAGVTADTAPMWAVQALGEVPADQAERERWEKSAGKMAAVPGDDRLVHEGQAIGPQPGTDLARKLAPSGRTRCRLMAKVDGVDVRGLSDGLLLAGRRPGSARRAGRLPASLTSCG